MTDQPKSTPTPQTSNARQTPNASSADNEQGKTATQATPSGNTLEGWRPPLDSDERKRYALDQAFDYRGDVTIETSDNRSIEGYVYDRQDKGEGLAIRIMPGDGSGRLTLGQSEIVGIEFTGKDTAEGRSFEAWIKKYAQKKQAGQEASLYHESS